MFATSRTAFAKKFAYPVRKRSNRRLKVVAALVDCNVALAAQQDVKTFVEPAGRNLLKGTKASLAVSLEYVIKTGFCLHVELNI